MSMKSSVQKHVRQHTVLPLALMAGMGTFGLCPAQTPGLPAAAEPTAPASRIGPPLVPPSTTAPPDATPSGSTPRVSGTMPLPRVPADPSGTTGKPMTPASAPRA
ncbi:MAG: hypothetical protein V4542_03415 [Pseudomonadota bacterium]